MTLPVAWCFAALFSSWIGEHGYKGVFWALLGLVGAFLIGLALGEKAEQDKQDKRNASSPYSRKH